MKRQLILLLSFVVFMATTFTVNAQITTLRPSPNAEVKQEVGLTNVTITYSRPGVKGRTIFADDGLVPFGKMWRLGANSATKIDFSDDVKVGGKDLKAGAYAVLAIPGPKEWTFNFYPYESTSWPSYTEKEPTIAVTVPSYAMPEGVNIESFTMGIADIVGNKALIEVLWDKTYVSIPLEVFVDERVEKQIAQIMAGPSANDYYAAASYYHDKGKDLGKALMWIQKATAGDDAMFWQVRREAMILADLGRYPEAIKAAKRSLELAQKAGNEEYVSMNKKSIEEWSKK